MKRNMLAAFAAIILAAIAAGVIIESPAASEETHPPHALPPVSADTSSFEATQVVWMGDAVAAIEAAQVKAYLDALHEAAQAQVAATTAAKSGGIGGSCNGDVACFLECTKDHESRTSGLYGAVSSSGTYRGAYQFDQATWNAAVAGAGWAEYAGMPADQVPPDIQDAAAAHLYSISGNRPWMGRC